MLYFTDILRSANIDANKVKLLRHPLSKPDVFEYYQADRIREFTAHQDKNFSIAYPYWAVFLGEEGTLSRFYALYKMDGWVPDTQAAIEPGELHPESFTGQYAYYHLETLHDLDEYKNKLLIDWGNSTRMWHQKGTTPKPIRAILPNFKEVFPGFENIILSFDELENIIESPTIYAEWKAALSSINAIYLIVNRENGKQYVGSAYGEDGLWGRWSCYINTKHGGNKEMIDDLAATPDHYHFFQFSILQILPKTVTAEEVIHTEALYKKKLLTISFGMNKN